MHPPQISPLAPRQVGVRQRAAATCSVSPLPPVPHFCCARCQQGLWGGGAGLPWAQSPSGRTKGMGSGRELPLLQSIDQRTSAIGRTTKVCLDVSCSWTCMSSPAEGFATSEMLGVALKASRDRRREGSGAGA